MGKNGTQCFSVAGQFMYSRELSEITDGSCAIVGYEMGINMQSIRNSITVTVCS